MELCKLFHLKEINLRLNKITWLPTNLYILWRLRYLDCRNNNLEQIDNLEKYTHLEKLDIRDNSGLDLRTIETKFVPIFTDTIFITEKKINNLFFSKPQGALNRYLSALFVKEVGKTIF